MRRKKRKQSWIHILYNVWSRRKYMIQSEKKDVYFQIKHWLCSHGLESCSERRFRTWFSPFLIWKPDFSPCERKVVSNQAFETRFETRKRGVLDRDLPRKPDSRTCERKALSERDSCVCILKMRAEAMHKRTRMGQSARADCAVGAKYYLAVRRSWSWLGRRLQCMWTHVVQITIPITFWIAIRNVFRNVILAHVNTVTDTLNWLIDSVMYMYSTCNSYCAIC